MSVGFRNATLKMAMGLEGFTNCQLLEMKTGQYLP